MPKTTFYKGEEQINITPEEAVTFQGGVQGDEFKGLLASGWSKTAPVVEPPTETPKTPAPENAGDNIQLDDGIIKTPSQNAGDDVNQALTDTIAQKQTDIDRYNTEFENLTADIEEIDAGNHPMIQDIKDTFARRSEEMKVQNEAIKNQTKIAGLRGMARYASQTQRGFISNEIKNGMDRLSQLESQKMTAIMEAKRALKSDRKDRWATFNDFMNQATQAYDSKINAIKDLHTALKDDEDRIASQAKADLETQQLKQEIVQTNLDMYASTMIGYDESGNLALPSQEDLQAMADDMGVDVNLLVGTVRDKYQELSKLDQEEQQRELNIAKAQQDLIPSLFREHKYAQENLGFAGTWQDYANYKEQIETSKPSSYKEWELAGGEAGTGKSYAQYIGGQQGLDSKTIIQVDKISSSFDSSPIVKNYNDVVNKKISVDRIIDAGVGGPGDLALVFEFMKALDPTSVVRESEYEAAAKSGNIFSGVYTRFNKGYFDPQGGLLPEEVKESFRTIISKKMDVIQSQYDNLKSEKARLINIKTGDIDGNDYLIDYDITPKEEDKYADLDTFLQKGSGQELKELLDLQDAFPDLSEEDLFGQYQQSKGFNQPLSTGLKGELSGLANSIVQQESGGSYTAVGQVPAGYSEADKALGKYQIVPKFHFSKIGLQNTESDRRKFLNSPQLQDKLFNIILTGLGNQYNNDPAKIAAAYYGGGGGASVVGTPAGDKPQYAGGKEFPSINEYVNSVLSKV